MDPNRKSHANILNEDAFDDLLSLASVISTSPFVAITLADQGRVWSNCGRYAHPDRVEFEMRILNGHVIGYLRILAITDLDLTQQQIDALELVAKIAADRLYKETGYAADLEKQNEFIDTVLEHLSDGLVACDAQGRLTIFNRASREFHGLDARKDIPQEQWPQYYSLYHADGITPMEMKDIPLLRAYNGETLQDVDMYIQCVDGRRRKVRCNAKAMRTKTGELQGAICTLHDITQIVEANAKVEIQTKLQHSLIELCPVGIAVFDLDGRVIMWNPENERIFGFTKEEMIGVMPRESHPDQSRSTFEYMRIVDQTKKPFDGYPQKPRKDGTLIDLHQTVLPLLNEKNEIYGYLSTFIDVSDVKQREVALMETNRALEAASVAKSEFLANMSHEIRTPLNGVIGMAELVLTTDLNGEQRDSLNIVHSSATNLLAIISDILDFSKIEAGKLEVEKVPFNLEELVNQVQESLQLAAQQKDLRLVKLVSGSTSGNFIGDPGRIRQVLNNLISNAIKFSESGDIRTSIMVGPAQFPNTSILISVEDTGVGIPADAMKRLFQPFSQADSSTTRRFGGTGLGLSISKRLVDLMGGEIGVESVVGSGSKFWFSLELGWSAPAPALKIVTPVEARVESTVSPVRILLAEDNLVNQKVAISMLRKLGYSADVVPNGQAATEALRTKTYDLVLMDCQMPVMDGYEATRYIRSEKGMPNNIRIVAVTANSMKGDREKCLDAGMNDYLPKPLKLDTLEEALLRNLA